ncbi:MULTISPECIES: hypothetical protein [Vibrio]|uniref:hypothetical protein n=1 Tax=Vibrio TaxID=662 RepID=UPI00078CDF47|nr:MULTISPECIES: hypothetical protein [Vibrio]BAU71051.1 hypothetical protein [Vibrio sp. 04Ya108]BBM67689.1 hypothetical protein VA249_43350 [Vibrio alfacsensis]BCN27186.1 hypothetical protein VYA_43780 [Vibrio alfacsensis]
MKTSIEKMAYAYELIQKAQTELNKTNVDPQHQKQIDMVKAKLNKSGNLTLTGIVALRRHEERANNG